MSDLWDKLQRAYDVGIQADGKESHFLILVAFLITFGIVRTITHAIRTDARWWPGHDLETKGGTHVHHLVPGILLLMFSGYLGLSVAPGSPWRELLAIVFGVGMALTLDEFALWLNLADVYWQDKGRQSIDAVIVAASLLVITFVGLSFWIEVFEALLTTFGMTDSNASDASGPILVGTQVLAIGLSGLSMLKGKRILAAVGLFVPLVALLTSVRLAKPQSRWARRFYDAGKLDRASARFPLP